MVPRLWAKPSRICRSIPRARAVHGSKANKSGSDGSRAVLAVANLPSHNTNFSPAASARARCQPVLPSRLVLERSSGRRYRSRPDSLRPIATLTSRFRCDPRSRAVLFTPSGLRPGLRSQYFRPPARLAAAPHVALRKVLPYRSIEPDQVCACQSPARTARFHRNELPIIPAPCYLRRAVFTPTFAANTFDRWAALRPPFASRFGGRFHTEVSKPIRVAPANRRRGPRVSTDIGSHRVSGAF